jgi:hypothetical protein
MKEFGSANQQPPDFEGTAVFPKECGNSEGTTATLISNILKGVKYMALQKKIVIEGFPENPTSTDLRSGAGNYLAIHPSKSLLSKFLIIALFFIFLELSL